ncbi:RsiV family protein [Pusillimonas sp. MFBS29]|uniref:RsiV family protein n=1 Tax=Pusillimonas sp. MFBS29 TaxID=2886690 RepID=UPI001D10B533|nr:RsiV family protein [Pusillimonas sp. MFBS29]MCC2595553.1 RsiV family protein [Pusillimonas sp. MFBS29]
MYSRPVFRFALTAVALGVLAACTSGPSANISRIPVEIGEQTSKEGLFTQEFKWEHTKPGCKGECPTLELNSLVFPGVPKLTELVDHALAMMTGIGTSGPAPYFTIKEYEDYFWKTAAPRDSTVMVAKARYRNRSLTVIELNTWQYQTGSAHGISATQFLNWDNNTGKVLSLDSILRPGQYDGYVAALKQAHANWLASHPDAQHDPETFNRMWPFQVSENFGFTDQGLVVKYDSYQLAPYSSGQPELVLPYSSLSGILRPEFMPAPA